MPGATAGVNGRPLPLVALRLGTGAHLPVERLGPRQLDGLAADARVFPLPPLGAPASPVRGVGGPSPLPRPAAAGTSQRTSDQGSGDQRAARFSKNASMPSL